MKDKQFRDFRFWCQKVLPLVYDDSLSYYEVLCKVVKWLNSLGADVAELAEYVQGLDIEAEVDEKFDELVESGYFQQLISQLVDYLYPEDYGAVGDGTTDDSAALADCFAASRELRTPVLLRNNYFINSTVTVPSYVRIIGLAKDETRPNIIVGSNCNLALNCTGIVNTLEGFIIKNYENSYRNFNGVVMTGNYANDVDSVVRNVDFVYMDTCLTIQGRNVDVLYCGFGHSRIGVYFDVPDQQMRGLNIDSCRFHGMGEEADIPFFTNDAGILIQQNYWSNVTVRNCISDQSGTFFKGYCTQGLFEGNYVESYAETPIKIYGPEAGVIGNTGTLLFEGNFISGKRGQVTGDYVASYPDHLVEIEDFSRVSFVGNLFRFSEYAGIYLDHAGTISVLDNTFTGVGMTGDAYMIQMLGNCGVIAKNNVATTSGITLFTGLATDAINVNGNVNFVVPTSTNVLLSRPDALIQFGTCASGSEIDFDLPNEFEVRTGDGHTCWACRKVGSYVSGGVSFDAGYTTMYCLTFSLTENVYTPVVKTIDLSNLNQYGSTATLYFYKRIN